MSKDNPCPVYITPDDCPLVGRKWVSKPDSEGWWWFKYGDDLEYLVILKLKYVNFEGRECLVDEDYTLVDRLRVGKFQRAILPSEEQA